MGRPTLAGVVGPKVYGDGPTNKMHGGMTIDVVHRNHLAIFREYYPPALDNWYTDTWIVCTCRRRLELEAKPRETRSLRAARARLRPPRRARLKPPRHDAVDLARQSST